MPNVGLVGIGGASTRYGRLYPTQLDSGALGSTNGLIVPEVIACPWSQDEAGVAIPSGTLAVRTMVIHSMADEYALPLTDGDDGDWILVPSSLPSGWTKRGRDSTRGAPLFANLGPPSFIDGTFLRGTPCYLPGYVFDIGHPVEGGAPAYCRDQFYPAPVDPGRSYPRRRDNAGLQDVTIYPLNLGRRTVQCAMTIGDYGNEPTLYGMTHVPLDGGGPFHIPQPCQDLYGNAWFQPHFGWRNIRLRLSVSTDTSASPDPWIVQTNVRVSHNADNSLGGTGANFYAGDTVDQLFSPTPTWTLDHSAGGRWYWVYDFDLGSFMPSGLPVMRAYYVSYVIWIATLTNYPTRPDISTGIPNVWCSPRLDIPLWFTVTGRNLVAPGGVPP